MNEVLRTVEYKGYRIEISRDSDINPRKFFDNLGEMVCWHNRYNLGDRDIPGESPQEHIDGLGRSGAVYLPLYLYDHSGLCIHTENFYGKVGYWHARFDSGQVGWISVSLERLRHEYGWQRVTAKRREIARKMLEVEVNTYNLYLMGDVYRSLTIGPDGEIVRSSGGFFGDDHEASELLPCTREEIDYLVGVSTGP